MIARIWRGPVAKARLDEYAGYMEETGLKAYAGTQGNRGAWMLAQAREGPEGGEEVEVMMLTFWDSWDAIRAFAGEPIDRAVYYPKDRDFLTRFDEKVEHFEVVRQVGPVDPASPS